MQNPENLAVYEYAHRLAVATYRHTESFPAAERFGVTIRIAVDLGYGDAASAEHLSSESNRVSKMLSRLITYLRSQPAWRRKEGRP